MLISILQHFSVEKTGIESLVNCLKVSQIVSGEERMSTPAFWHQGLEY